MATLNRKAPRRALAMRALAFVVATIAAAFVGVFAASSYVLERRHDDVPLPAFTGLAAPTAADLAEGERMARIVGCWAGCHGPEGQGGSDDRPGFFTATAPTLSDVLPHYGDAELVRLIRFGIKRDGRSTLGMSAATFYALGDADLARIIAHLRHQPVSPPHARTRDVTLAGRIALLTGAWKTSADDVVRTMPRWGELAQDDAFARGRYLVSITCTECHGLDLHGVAHIGSPPMDVLASYDLAQFRHLLRTGEPIGGRDLGIMSWVARVGFRYFTDAEIAAIYAYLRDYRRGPPTGIGAAR